MARKPRAAGYFRISAENGRGDALEAPAIYKDQIARHAADLGAEHDPDQDCFADVNVSGGVDPLLRGGFEAWHGRNQEWDLLIVPTVARFSRDVESGTAVANRLLAEGVRIEFVDRRGLDRSTAIGRFTFTQDLAIAQLQRDQARETWQSATLNAARQGRPARREAPYGYVHHKHAVPTVNAKQAEVVREVFERKARGESLHGIYQDLTRRAVPAPRGDTWSRSTIRRMIRNTFYVGEQSVAGEVFKGAWEPLIDRDTHERANALLGERPKRWTSGMRYPLTGILFCECGGRMYFDARARRASTFYRCSVCARRIAANRAEAKIDAEVVKKLRDDHVQHVLAEPDSLFASEGDAEEVDRLEQRRKQLQRRISGWIEELADLPSNLRAPVRKRLEESAAELERAEDRIALLRATSESARVSAAVLRDATTELEAMLAHASPEEKNRLLGLCIERAIVVEPRKGRRVDGRIGAGRGRDIEIEWVPLLQ
jgi:DNA invertase Pin-like site-specific DNA recombinase